MPRRRGRRPPRSRGRRRPRAASRRAAASAGRRDRRAARPDRGRRGLRRSSLAVPSRRVRTPLAPPERRRGAFTTTRFLRSSAGIEAIERTPSTTGPSCRSISSRLPKRPSASSKTRIAPELSASSKLDARFCSVSAMYFETTSAGPTMATRASRRVASSFSSSLISRDRYAAAGRLLRRPQPRRPDRRRRGTTSRSCRRSRGAENDYEVFYADVDSLIMGARTWTSWSRTAPVAVTDRRHRRRGSSRQARRGVAPALTQMEPSARRSRSSPGDLSRARGEPIGRAIRAGNATWLVGGGDLRRAAARGRPRSTTDPARRSAPR